VDRAGEGSAIEDYLSGTASTPIRLCGGWRMGFDSGESARWLAPRQLLKARIVAQGCEVRIVLRVAAKLVVQRGRLSEVVNG
jgi:hypothetical protein